MLFFSGRCLLGLEAGQELNSCGYCSSREGGKEGRVLIGRHV